MRKYIWLVAAAALTVSLSVGVASASAGGGNSANAKLCQKGGWMNLVASDGTTFASEQACVSYGARGGTLRPKPTCTGVTQTFDGTTTPAGWTVVNNTPVGGWQFNDPNPRGNLTGGSGGFAIIDSDFLGIGNTEDTFLISPATDFTGISSPQLSFDNDYHALDSVADVDVSINGGATWTNLWEHTADDVRGPSHIDIPLASAANQADAQVRFHYTGTWAWWWEVDNVFLGHC